MTIYAGFDCFTYPGDDKMRAWIADTNLRWCGLYITSPLWLPKENQSAYYNAIKRMGWGVAPIYLGKQPDGTRLPMIIMQYRGRPDDLKKALYNEGISDGMEAVSLAAAAQIQPPSVIYFDSDNPTNENLNWLEYYRGWSRYLVDHGYQAGLYARQGNATWITTDLMKMRTFDMVLPEIWIVDYVKVNTAKDEKGHLLRPPDTDFLTSPFPTPDPRTNWSGATSWQHRGNFGIKWSGQTFWPIDFSSSVYRDPGLGFLSTIGSTYAPQQMPQG